MASHHLRVTPGDNILAAVCYCISAMNATRLCAQGLRETLVNDALAGVDPPPLWPFAPDQWRPHSVVDDLAQASAFIQAELAELRADPRNNSANILQRKQN